MGRLDLRDLPKGLGWGEGAVRDPVRDQQERPRVGQPPVRLEVDPTQRHLRALPLAELEPHEALEEQEVRRHAELLANAQDPLFDDVRRRLHGVERAGQVEKEVGRLLRARERLVHGGHSGGLARMEAWDPGSSVVMRGPYARALGGAVLAEGERLPVPDPRPMPRPPSDGLPFGRTPRTF